MEMTMIRGVCIAFALTMMLCAIINTVAAEGDDDIF